MNEFLYILLLLTITTVTIVTGKNSVVGIIKENTTWFLSNLSVRHAKTASLEYHVQYPYVPNKPTPSIIFYYNGQNSPNLKTHCATDFYGQLRNEDLAVPLDELYRGKFFCYHDYTNWYCSGNTTIQDFEPKSYSFSFCFDCDEKYRGNLKGLWYYVTIYDESNKTSCVDLKMVRGQRIDRCERSYEYAAIPNQVGGTNLDTTRWQLGQVLGILDKIIDLVQYKSCLLDLYQVLCLVALPKCLLEENEIVLPCREYCESLLENCLKMEPIVVLVEEFVLNCKYLPSQNGSTHCFMKYEVCGPPPKIEHGYIVGGSIPFGREGQVVQYKCDIMYWIMTGSPNSTCKASGEWTDPPECGNITAQ